MKHSSSARRHRSWWHVAWVLILASAVVGTGLLLWFPESTLTENQVAEEYAKSLTKWKRGNKEAATIGLRKILRAKTAASKTTVQCAQLAIELDSIPLAEEFVERLNHAERFRLQFHYFRGVLAIHDNHAQLAERWWRAAAADNPAFTASWERLCQLFMTQIRTKDIQWALMGLSRCRPLSIDELVVLGNPYEPYYSPEERMSVVQDYVRADPQDLHSVAALARYQLMADLPDEAFRTLQSPAVPQWNDATAQVRLEVLLRLGKDLDLNDANAGSLQREPLASISRSTGLVAWNQGNWSAAAWFLRDYLKSDPHETEALYKLGQSLERLGETSAANIALEMAKQNEELNNLLFRIRRTTHLTIQKLTPLVIETAQRLADQNRFRESIMWLNLIRDQSNGKEIARSVIEKEATAKARIDEQWHVLNSVKLQKPGGPTTPHITSAATAWPDAPPVKFVDCHELAGIDFKYDSGAIGKKWLLETLGGGIAVLDYDSDGWPDLYFCQGGPIIEGTFSTSDGAQGDRLFRNLHDGRFQDVTRDARLGDQNYSHGCAAGDFDNDGDTDLLVTNFGENQFYSNNGDGTFTNITSSAGLTGKRWHTSAAFGDFDGDGDLDLYISTYVGEAFKTCRRPNGSYSACSPANYAAEPDVLMWNRGDGTFEDISQASNILSANGKGLGVVAADLDNDGRMDIYVTNDGTPNFLFHNEGNDAEGYPTFFEIGLRSGTALNGNGLAQAGMGIACQDFDGNGWLDLFTTNFFNEGSTLYLNQGSNLFIDATGPGGLIEPTRKKLGFGTQAIEIGFPSQSGVFIANGHIDDFNDRNEPWKMTAQLFASDGKGHFQERSQSAGEFFQQPQLGRAVARLDFNRDLRPDLVVGYLDRQVALLRNDSTTDAHAISIRFVGVVSNRDGVGCRIKVANEDQANVRELSGGDGYLASNERRMILAIKKPGTSVELIVQWPSGLVDRITNVQVGDSMNVIEGSGSAMVDTLIRQE